MRALVLGVVLLAAGSVAAQAEDRKCIPDRDMGMCNEKRYYVTNPNEYGWDATSLDSEPRRVKGFGWKQKKSLVCSFLESCRPSGE
jgi:hypothetical protein